MKASCAQARASSASTVSAFMRVSMAMRRASTIEYLHSNDAARKQVADRLSHL